jgi:hypothetical protein
MFLNPVTCCLVYLFIASIKCNPIRTGNQNPTLLDPQTSQKQEELLLESKGSREISVSKEEEIVDILFRLFKSCKSVECKIKLRQVIVRLVGEHVWDMYKSHLWQTNNRHVEKDFFNIRY